MNRESDKDLPYLQARGIVKRFGGVTALDHVDLDIRRGETLALLGDNGAGKSTLVKIISGAYGPTEGVLTVDGTPVAFASPQNAADSGIATIFQELALSDNLSVVENVFLGREMVRSILGFPLMRKRAMRDRVEQLLKELDAHVPNVTASVGSLSGGQRQAVAISRALNLDAQLVIMDEPTAALAVAETRKVLDLIQQLTDRGCAVLLVSHNIADVFEVADRMVVLRRGRKVAERAKSDTHPEEIIAMITGVHPEVRAQLEA